MAQVKSLKTHKKKSNMKTSLTASKIYSPSVKSKVTVRDVISVIRKLKNINNDISKVSYQKISAIAQQSKKH
jgi:hypothetical protein